VINPNRAGSVLAPALRGAAAGAVATLAMSALMLGAERSGVTGQLPPDRIAGRLLHLTGGRWRRRRAQAPLAAALHLAFGCACGALFALGARRLRVPVPRPLQGAVFATGVWALSYQGWVPALNIMPPASRDRPGRVKTMLIAHWLYGGVLGVLAPGGNAARATPPT
jgi:hypothetical protein